MTRKYYSFILLVLGVLLLIFTASCQTNQSQNLDTLDEGTPEFTAEIDQTTEEIEEETSLPEEELVVVVDECLQCHTDQQALTDTADPIVVVESENSGEG